MRDARSVNPRSVMSAPETAVMLMAVVSIVASRFAAVTTISSSCPLSDGDCCAPALPANMSVIVIEQLDTSSPLRLLERIFPFSLLPIRTFSIT